VSVFVYRLNPPRPSFFEDQDEDEKNVMAEHVKYWKRLLLDGKAVAFGSVLDGNAVWGLAVVDVETKEEACALRGADPAITSGMTHADILPIPQAVLRPLT